MRLGIRVVLLVAVGLAGFFLVDTLRNGRERRVQNVLAAVHTQPYTTVLDPSGRSRSFAGTPVIQDPRRPVRLACWSKGVYAGSLDDDVVRILIESRRAGTLAGNLTKAASARLETYLVDAEREIPEAAMLADEEVQRTKKGRIVSESLHLVDPAYRGPAMVYYVLEYEDWPALTTLEFEFNRAVRHRLRLTREWIEAQFAGRVRDASRRRPDRSAREENEKREKAMAIANQPVIPSKPTSPCRCASGLTYTGVGQEIWHCFL